MQDAIGRGLAGKTLLAGRQAGKRAGGRSGGEEGMREELVATSQFGGPWEEAVSACAWRLSFGLRPI